MPQFEGSDTQTIRVTKKGKKEYERLLSRYAPRIRKAAFIEELTENYEQSKKSQEKTKNEIQ